MALMLVRIAAARERAARIKMCAIGLQRSRLLRRG